MIFIPSTAGTAKAPSGSITIGLPASNLVQKCTFTRQTRRINLEHELQNYIKEHPNDYRIKSRDFEEQFIGKIRDYTIVKRSKLPPIPLKSSDFWEFPLIFPKGYTQGDDSPDAKTKNAEICYRDIFKAGAIKIQLGRQRTMFYIPEEKNVTIPPLNKLSKVKYDDLNCYLFLADWEPFYKGSSTHYRSITKPLPKWKAPSEPIPPILTRRFWKKPCVKVLLSTTSPSMNNMGNRLK